MKVDAIVAEIGSTTTVVSAFRLGDTPCFLGQGISPSPQHSLVAPHGDAYRDVSPHVHPADVTVALRQALDDLARNLGTDDLEWTVMMAASSAAGGLSMSVHGLVYDMTAKAAKEAALNAGGVVKLVTAGDITPHDVILLKRIRPKMILLAGGVDHGEKDTAIRNARIIADLNLGVPVLYAGNIGARPEIAEVFESAGVEVRFSDNVYPYVDELVVEPARKVIQDIFEDHIVTAPGMDRIRTMVKGTIMPTPGAVMEACKMLWPVMGDLCAVDVGGATTDVHSVAKGSPEIQAILESPEPLAKRTVEGDLGVYINAPNVLELVKDRAEADLGFDPVSILKDLQAIPEDARSRELAAYLTQAACRTAFSRHVGRIKYLYGPQGRLTLAIGKDLSSVRTIIGTGGPLTRLPGGQEALESLVDRGPGKELHPKAARTALDSQYIMAACGVLGRGYPAEATAILMGSLGLA